VRGQRAAGVTEIEPYRPVPATGGVQDTAEQLVRRWLTGMPSPHTRFNYGLDIGVRMPRPGAKEGSVPKPGPAKAPGWLPFCAALGIDPLAAQREHVDLWARGMEAAGLSEASIARKLAAVSSWYAWLIDGEYLASSPVKKTHRPRIDPDISKTPGLIKDQALAMLAAADSSTTPQAARNAALAGLLLFTGARVSEACGATLADLGMDRGHRVLWVTRKGRQRQPLALPPPVLERLDAHLTSRADLDYRPALLGAAGKDRPLIATKRGEPMLPADVWALMRRLGKAAGLPPELVAKMGAHSMRHSFATLYLDAGGNLRDLQDAMGHKDPRTTRRYDRARGRLDRSPGYLLANYLADGEAGG
jgi:integrase/recombinase XerD